MTTSTEARDLIERFMAAVNAADVDAMLECVADDLIHDVNQGERRLGKSRFHAYAARMSHHYKETLSGIVVMLTPDGTRAAAEYNISGTYVATDGGLPEANGQTYALPGAMFFAIKDGRIQRLSHYYNLTDWIIQVTGGSIGEPEFSGQA
ncbi:MAG: nuclear transport factor 2 family protein [Hyphomicrobiaceae bacterium]|nr:nuclear transport factor 2 family protein [Hyphomicrobiaceae bacterium]